MGLSKNSALSAGLYPIADEGTFFTATNAAAGTGLASSITTAFSATAGLLTVRNGSTGAGQNRRLCMNSIRLIPTVAPASATRSEFAITIDDITRYASGGSAITPVNPNMDSATAPSAVVHFGALVLAAAGSNVRLVSRGQLRSSIPVAFEEYVIDFRGTAHSEGTLGGATAVRNVSVVPPVVLGPGQSMQLHVWHPANAATAASWEFEVTGWAR